jgi:hypothetical protein
MKLTYKYVLFLYNMDKLPDWPFYAESILFQSPHPSELPVPMFHDDGSFVDGPWKVAKHDHPAQVNSPKVLKNGL